MVAIQARALGVVPFKGKWRKRYKKLVLYLSKVGVEKEGG
jgi:hypothetical protein